TRFPTRRSADLKGTADQEPWVHGPEQEAIRRRYIELRYRLLPYIYTSVEETVRTGLPLERPLFLEKQRPFQRQTSPHGLFHAGVDVRQKPVAQFDVAAANGFLLRAVYPGLLVSGALQIGRASCREAG